MLFTFQYVPICFYYFSFYDTITDFVSKIYIPICFYYFPSIPSALIPSRSSFTFQYVSIISVHSRTIDIVRSKFTFQYVSIISVSTSEPLIEGPLFTFQYVSIISIFHYSWRLQRYSIYIPICFYYFKVL